jgi:hypothetical protein
VVTIQVNFHNQAVVVVEAMQILKEQQIWVDEGAAVLIEREEIRCLSQRMRAWLVMGAGLMMGAGLALLEAGRSGQGVRHSHGRCR